MHVFFPSLSVDTKVMASSKDDKTRDAVMTDLKLLCDATREIFESHQNPHVRNQHRNYRILVLCSKLYYNNINLKDHFSFNYNTQWTGEIFAHHVMERDNIAEYIRNNQCTVPSR